MSQNASTDATTQNGQEPTDDAPSLTPKQRETLAAVRDRPTASQAEIADALGVTRGTVSRRLNDIPEFEWSDRARIVETYFDTDDSRSESADAGPEERVAEGSPGVGAGGSDPAGGGPADVDSSKRGSDSAAGAAASETVPVGPIQSRLDAIEEQLQTDADTSDALDSELVHKVVHACMESDVVSSEAELAVIDFLMR